MNKKCLRVFVNSFVVSLFAIWVADELMLVSKPQTGTIDVPESNISLFLQSRDNVVAPIKAVGVSSSSLSFIKQVPSEAILVDESVFSWESVRINSIDEVADIPLEYSKNNHAPKKPTKRDVSSPAIALENLTIDKELKITKEINSTALENAEIPFVASVTTETPTAEAVFSAEVADNDMGIPLQKGLPENFNNIITSSNPPAANQVAMLKNVDTQIDTLKVDTLGEEGGQKNWTHMSSLPPVEKAVLDKAAGLSENINIAPVAMADESQEVQVAEMVKNILIPIPEDILKDKNLKPQLVSPKKSGKVEVMEVATKGEVKLVDEKESKAKSGGIFKSLTSMFSASEEVIPSDNEEAATDSKNGESKGGIFSRLGKKKQQSSAKILPAEIKLSFQPGRAEISGQTLRWIEAFATKAVDDDSVFLEIRIDGNSSFELQQKRLNLLYRILANKGVHNSKVNTVFTSREPNSFIIRTLKMSDNNDTMQKNNKRQTLNYRSW